MKDAGLFGIGNSIGAKPSIYFVDTDVFRGKFSVTQLKFRQFSLEISRECEIVSMLHNCRNEDKRTSYFFSKKNPEKILLVAC